MREMSKTMITTMLFAAGALDSGVPGMWGNRSDLSSHIALAVGGERAGIVV